MYRCQICGTVQSGAQLRHVVYRHVEDRVRERMLKQVEREIPVCTRCHKALSDGTSLTELQQSLKGKTWAADILTATDGEPVATPAKRVMAPAPERKPAPPVLPGSVKLFGKLITASTKPVTIIKTKGVTNAEAEAQD